jgi:hypothetical protein
MKRIHSDIHRLADYGVQSIGENYQKILAVLVQVMPDKLNDARNELNAMVLDAGPAHYINPASK